MKIAINALSAKIGGGITYIKNVAPRLAKYDTKNEYYLFVSDENYYKLIDEQTSFEGVRIIKIRTYGLFSRLFREQIVIPYYVLAEKIDILFCPANLISFFAPCKKVLWIQNIDPFIKIRGETFLKRLRIGLLRLFTFLSMKHSSVVVFSSNYSRDLALSETGIEESKTKRIFLGAEISKFKRDDVMDPGVGKQYLLSVSNISERKNYEVLIKAYCLLDKCIRDRYLLILVGDVNEKYKNYLLSICKDEEICKRIIFKGMLLGEDLFSVYKRASLFVLPSLVESFSLPVIEAMAAGLPVIASNITCLPEMIGNYGLLFDPCDPNDLANKIREVINNRNLYDSLSRKSAEHAKIFSWDETALNIIKMFREAL